MRAVLSDRLQVHGRVVSTSIQPSVNGPTVNSIVRASHVTSHTKQVSAGMTATLYAEFGGTVPCELVAEVVRTVVDENRHVALEPAVALYLIEARQRLERFIRART